MKVFFQTILFVLLVGCSPAPVPNPTTTLTIPPTASAIPPTSTSTEVLATTTATEVPATATVTKVPPTATPEITSTPDYSDYAKFTPEPATINEANWNGVNLKLAKIEYSLKMTPLEPNQKPIAMGQGKKTANAYFITKQEDILTMLGKSKVNEIYVSVTFSDGEKEVSWSGTMRDSGQPSVKLLRGIGASTGGKPEGWSEVDLVFNIPVDDSGKTNENMKITQIKMAANKSVKNDAVTLYEK